MGSQKGRQSILAPPLIRAGVLHPLAAFMRRTGTSLPVLISKGGLARLPKEETAFYPFNDAVALIHQAALRSGIEYLAYIFGRENGLRSLGPYGDFIVSAPSLYCAILRANMLVNWVSPSLTLSLVHQGQLMSWHARHPGQPGKLANQGYLHTISLFVEVVRLAVEIDWGPVEVRLGDRDLANPVLETLIGAPLRFVDDEWSIVFPRSFLALPIKRPFWSRDGHGYETLERTALAKDLTTSLKALVRSLLTTGQADEQLLSRIMDMPKRTFQRQFQGAVGVPFRTFIAEVRFEEAKRLIAEPTSKLRDVAAALGYTEHGNFTRAFAKWSGMSPSEYRMHLLAGDVDHWREMTKVSEGIDSYN